MASNGGCLGLGGKLPGNPLKERGCRSGGWRLFAINLLLAAVIAVTLLAHPLAGQSPLPEPGDATLVLQRDVGSGSPGSRYGSVSWSPDGQTITFSRIGEVSRLPDRPGLKFHPSDIWVVGIQGQSPRRLTRQAAGEHNDNPSWSPDGRRIIFNRSVGLDVLVTGPTPRWTQEIWTINPDGSGARALTNLGRARDPSWSPDGTKIVFSGAGASGNSRVYVMNADGSGASSVWEGPGNVESPRFVGDSGKFILVANAREVIDSSSTNDLQVLDPRTRELRTVATGQGHMAPVVSPDGKFIVYGRGDVLWIMTSADAIAGVVPEPQTRSLTAGRGAAFSPDGARIAFAKDPWQIWVLTLKQP
ncbi:MAG: hypothetical protein FJX73_00930 [Armatimonadetes bacterium]|nr:hypothetical protein [Armatimonadota bacterium]